MGRLLRCFLIWIYHLASPILLLPLDQVCRIHRDPVVGLWLVILDSFPNFRSRSSELAVLVPPEEGSGTGLVDSLPVPLSSLSHQRYLLMNRYFTIFEVVMKFHSVLVT